MAAVKSSIICGVAGNVFPFPDKFNSMEIYLYHRDGQSTSKNKVDLELRSPSQVPAAEKQLNCGKSKHEPG